MTQSPNKATHLQVADVHCSPPTRPALRGVNLAVSRGSFLAITGNNGSGKGTLCRCLARLTQETQGRILLDGQRLPDQPEALPAAGMMVVLQGAKVFPEMSVVDNLLCAPTSWRKRDRVERLDAIMELFPHLKHRFRQNGGSLSGGEQQMVAIGRALMAGPSLLVLEEPSLGLAAQTTNDVYAALAQVCGQGRTVIVTEEALTIAAPYANAACLMDYGRIAAIGRPQDILDGISGRQSALLA